MLPYDMLFLILKDYPLKSGRLINKTISNFCLNKYINHMLPITTKEVNSYIDNDVNIYVRIRRTHYFCDNYLHIKGEIGQYTIIDDHNRILRYQQADSFSDVVYVDLFTQYKILCQRVNIGNKLIKHKILFEIGCLKIRIYSGSLPYVYNWLLINCYVVGLIDYFTINIEKTLMRDHAKLLYQLLYDYFNKLD